MIYEASICEEDRQLLSCRGNDKDELLAWIYRQLELNNQPKIIGFLYDRVNEIKRAYINNPHRD